MNGRFGTHKNNFRFRTVRSCESQTCIPERASVRRSKLNRLSDLESRACCPNHGAGLRTKHQPRQSGNSSVLRLVENDTAALRSLGNDLDNRPLSFANRSLRLPSRPRLTSAFSSPALEVRKTPPSLFAEVCHLQANAIGIFKEGCVVVGCILGIQLWRTAVNSQPRKTVRELIDFTAVLDAKAEMMQPGRQWIVRTTMPLAVAQGQSDG